MPRDLLGAKHHAHELVVGADEHGLPSEAPRHRVVVAVEVDAVRTFDAGRDAIVGVEVGVTTRSSPVHAPITRLNLRIAEAVDYGYCQICRTLFRAGVDPKRHRFSRVARESVRRALQGGKGLMFWNRELVDRVPHASQAWPGRDRLRPRIHDAVVRRDGAARHLTSSLGTTDPARQTLRPRAARAGARRGVKDAVTAHAGVALAVIGPVRSPAALFVAGAIRRGTAIREQKTGVGVPVDWVWSAARARVDRDGAVCPRISPRVSARVGRRIRARVYLVRGCAGAPDRASRHHQQHGAGCRNRPAHGPPTRKRAVKTC